MNLAATLWWYAGNIREYILQMLPCMCAALALFFLLRPARKARLVQNGLVSGLWREGALLVFVMFSAGLAALTLFPAGFWSLYHWRLALQGERPLFPAIDWSLQLQNLQLTPFHEIRHAVRGPWVLFLMLANIGIFVPVGFFTALLWRSPRWWKAIFIGCCTSGAIELIQFFIGRSTDIDDVILNTAGTLIGFWVFCLLHGLLPGLTANFQCRARGERI